MLSISYASLPLDSGLLMRSAQEHNYAANYIFCLVSNSLHSEPSTTHVTSLETPFEVTDPPADPQPLQIVESQTVDPQTEPDDAQVPTIRPTLSKKNEAAPLLTKGPGWYQQMFQTFSNKVEDAFPGGI